MGGALNEIEGPAAKAALQHWPLFSGLKATAPSGLRMLLPPAADLRSLRTPNAAPSGLRMLLPPDSECCSLRTPISDPCGRLSLIA
jgi:hypothetical protein